MKAPELTELQARKFKRANRRRDKVPASAAAPSGIRRAEQTSDQIRENNG